VEKLSLSRKDLYLFSNRLNVLTTFASKADGNALKSTDVDAVSFGRHRLSFGGHLVSFSRTLVSLEDTGSQLEATWVLCTTH
jgi:hypothetical protein